MQADSTEACLTGGSSMVDNFSELVFGEDRGLCLFVLILSALDEVGEQCPLLGKNGD